MPAFLLAIVKINDDAWIPDYAANVHGIVAKYGGKYLSRSSNLTNAEGEPLDADAIALVQFPSMEDAQAFCKDPEYAPYAKARQDGTVSRFIIIDDTDAMGTIPYLSKAE